MKTINYNFENFITIMANIKAHDGKNAQDLRNLKNELNKFFPESTCTDILCTQNTDKLFFGMRVIPDFSSNPAEIFFSEKPIKISKYIIEIDSKLFDESLLLSSQELTAVILHEVGHLVTSSAAVEEAKTEMDKYLAKNSEYLQLKDSANYMEILLFGFKDLVRRFSSIFEKDPNEETMADEFVVRCGFGPQLETAIKKIYSKKLSLNKGVSNKFTVWAWTLSLYKDVKHQRIPALAALRKSKTLTGSQLDKKEYDRVINRLNQMETINEAALPNLMRIFSDKVTRLKYKGIKGLHEDYFELALRCKNVTYADEARLLIRTINTNISIIENYLEEEELGELMRDSIQSILDDYYDLREKLLKKDLPREKQIMDISYPEIKQKY